MSRVADKVVLVTGAGSGIGRAAAKRMHAHDVAARLRFSKKARKRLAAALAPHTAQILPSFANFLTVRLHQPAAPIVAALHAQGIEVQYLGWPDKNGAIRISIGSAAESDRLLAALIGELGE